MYGFCSNNIFYSGSLSFRVFIICFFWLLLILLDCFYFMSNLSLVSLIKLLLIEICNVSLFLCLFGISLGQYCQKNIVVKSGSGKGEGGRGRVRKNLRRLGCPYKEVFLEMQFLLERQIMFYSSINENNLPTSKAAISWWTWPYIVT